MFTEKAQAIIDLAKDCAFARAKEELDIESLLAVVGSDAEAGVRLAECIMNGDVANLRGRCPELGQPAPCPGKLDLTESVKEIIAYAMDLASGDCVPDRFHPGLIDICHLICAMAMSRDICRLLGVFSQLSREDAIRLLTVWYEQLGSAVSIADLVNRLRGLRTELQTRVFGQDHAIYSFIEGLYNAEVTAAADRERKRPAAVFVFCGPPGVGKTYMAEICAKFLGRPFKRFDMTAYTDHQAHNQLVGFAPSYQGAQPGVLTGFVAKNPNAFLLFDEIEKVHLNTIQLFYQILDAGRLEDKFIGQDVSFRDTVIIFTTNAGRSLYDNPNKIGISVANSSYHKRTILSALENEKNPTTGQPAFPQAICSRLAQGYPVMFNHMGINELERISATEIARIESLLEKQYFKNFSHEPLLPISLVLHEGGQVDARQVRAETERFVKAELFKFCSLYAKDRLGDVLEEIDKVRFDIESGVTNIDPEVYALYESLDKPKILLVANSKFTKLCQQYVTEMQWVVASTPEEVIDALSTEDIDMVLLDIWIQRDMSKLGKAHIAQDSFGASEEKGKTAQAHDFIPLSAHALDEGRKILRKIHERFPQIPIYLLSFTDDSPKISGEKRRKDYKLMATISIDDVHDARPESAIGETSHMTIDDELFLACVREGGARGLIATNFFITSDPDLQKRREQFAISLKEITRRLYREKKARSLAQARKVLLFDTAAEINRNKRTLFIRLRDFRLGRAIEAADAGEMVDDVQRPTTRFDDVIGAEEAKESLQFVVDWLRDPKRYASIGVRPPKGILLTGSPGTGKTMLARAVAGESNCAFLETSATSFVTIWQGSGPQNIRDLFDRARRYAPAIVFIDEIDAIGKQRSGTIGSGRSQEETLNALLTEMDGFLAPALHPVFILAATNMEEILDGALKRRFDKIIEVDKPDRAARQKYLIKTVLNRKNSKVTPQLIERIAGQTAGLSIANLERIVHEAAVMAAQKGDYLKDEIFLEAFEKVMIGVVREKPDLKTLERIARHESGHTLISWLNGNAPVQVTIIGRGGAGGYMEPEVDEKKILRTKLEIEQKIRELMGGRASEIIFYGKEEGLSSGASNDLKSATEFAVSMVREYGMADDFGQVALSGQLYDGPLAIMVTQSAERIVKEQLQIAIKTLKENRNSLDVLVKNLLEKNRLIKEDLEKILPLVRIEGENKL